MDASLLLPFEAALPKRRRLPPPVVAPLNRSERVELRRLRHKAKCFLWHPDDNLDAPEMSDAGFAGADRNSNGSDAPPEFTTLQAMHEAIARREAARRGAA